jgi:hypothetical protein
MEYPHAMAKATSRKGSRKGPASSSRLTAAPLNEESKPLNRSLSAAKTAKQDEFYTQYIDIQKEVEAYLEFDPDTFRGKVVYCNCDDPFESNFFKYFAVNFNRLGLKKLITTSYDGSPIAGQQVLFPEYDQADAKRRRPHSIAVAVEIDEVTDLNGDGATGIADVKLFLERNPHSRTPLAGGGDFRSRECVAFLKQADIVVTNPPFSLFREYVAQLVEYGKKFLIIGNQNAITYKEIFPLIKGNKLWLGVDNGGTKWFQVKDDYDITTESRKKIENGIKYFSMGSIMWFTNLDHGRRHQILPLMTTAENVKFSKNLRGKGAYERYDNYDAIEVPTYKEIPSDHDGVMGVPITFLDRYNPEQFEIVGTTESNDADNDCRTRVYTSKECRAAYLKRFGKPGTYDLNASGVVNGVKVFKRVLIRHRRRARGKK